MTEPVSYILRWKGQQYGPLTKPEITEKLISGDISMAHEILISGQWTGLHAFMSHQEAQDELARQKMRVKQLQDELDQKEQQLQEANDVIHEMENQPDQQRNAIRVDTSQYVQTAGRIPFQYISKARRTHGMAVTGLVLGIVGTFVCAPLLGIGGIIFSSIAISQINRQPHSYKGKEMAYWGLALSILDVSIGTLLTIYVINNYF